MKDIDQEKEPSPENEQPASPWENMPDSAVKTAPHEKSELVAALKATMLADEKTQQEIADDFQVSCSYLTKILKGIRPVPVKGARADLRYKIEEYVASRSRFTKFEFSAELSKSLCKWKWQEFVGHLGMTKNPQGALKPKDIVKSFLFAINFTVFEYPIFIKNRVEDREGFEEPKPTLGFVFEDFQEFTRGRLGLSGPLQSSTCPLYLSELQEPELMEKALGDLRLLDELIAKVLAVKRQDCKLRVWLDDWRMRISYIFDDWDTSSIYEVQIWNECVPSGEEMHTLTDEEREWLSAAPSQHSTEESTLVKEAAS